MAGSEHLIQIYGDLANCEANDGSPQMRDRFLLLAADAALTAERPDLAQQLHEQLLEANPTHLVKPFATVADALQAPQVSSYLDHLRGQYPPAEAARMLGLDSSGLEKQPEAFDPDEEAIPERCLGLVTGTSCGATSAIFSTRCLPKARIPQY